MSRTLNGLGLAVLILLVPTLRAENKDKKPAVVIVRLPASAELTIGGVKSKQKKGVREFDTPPLAPGKKYGYPLKAVWKDGDKEVRREELIVVQAGETTDIDLHKRTLIPPNIEQIPAPEVMPEVETKPEPKKKPEPEKMPELEIIPEPKVVPEKEPQKKPEAEKQPEPEKKIEPVKKPEPEKKPERDNPPPAAKGSLSISTPETVNLKPGGMKLFPIKIVRTDCAGPVRLTFEGLPPGVELQGTVIAADKEKIYVSARAGAGVEEKEWPVRIAATSGMVRQEYSFTIKIAK